MLGKAANRHKSGAVYPNVLRQISWLVRRVYVSTQLHPVVVAPSSMYGARTSFTSLLEFLAEEARNDALENDGRGRTTDAVRDSSDEWKRAARGFVSRVWDLPADGLCLAEPLPTVANADADRGA